MTREIALIVAQSVVVVVLGVCVILGHDSAITDGLLAVSGSVAGIGVFEKIKTKSK
jgi:hypothetical protein